MDQTEQTIHPAVLTAAEPAFGPGWLLLARTPKGPSEERVLGTRTVLVSLVGATTDQLQRAANETMNLYDKDASASPAERARRALTAAQKQLGEKVAVGLVALSRDEVLVARTSGVAIAARRTTDGRAVTIMLPDDAPGAASRTLERGGISTARLSMSPEDRVALAITADDAKRAVKTHTPVSGVLAPLAYPAVLLEVLLPVRKVIERATTERDTLVDVPTDPVAVAKINARTRWEEGTSNARRASRPQNHRRRKPTRIDQMHTRSHMNQLIQRHRRPLMRDAQAREAAWIRARAERANRRQPAISEQATQYERRKKPHVQKRDCAPSTAVQQSHKLSDPGASVPPPLHRSGSVPLRVSPTRLNAERHGSRSPRPSHHFAPRREKKSRRSMRCSAHDDVVPQQSFSLQY